MDIYLDPSSHDIVLDGDDLRVTVDSEVVVQRLKIALQHLAEEWYLDTDLGIPYTQTIFEQGAIDLDMVYAIFISEIRKVDGVEDLTSLNITLDRDERQALVELVVNDNVAVEVTI